MNPNHYFAQESNAIDQAMFSESELLALSEEMMLTDSTRIALDGTVTLCAGVFSGCFNSGSTSGGLLTFKFWNS
jgi:hypothetical protein